MRGLLIIGAVLLLAGSAMLVLLDRWLTSREAKAFLEPSETYVVGSHGTHRDEG